MTSETPLVTPRAEARVEVYVGLGSNLESPARQLQTAYDSLQQHQDLHDFACSPLYGSVAVGPPQPDYVNAVARFTTLLAPEVLLDVLQAVEAAQGRVREQHWGPRTLDLDLLLYGNQVISTQRLCVPHAELRLRNFVLQPLCDLAPEIRLPDDGSKAADHLARVGQRGLAKLPITISQRIQP